MSIEQRLVNVTDLVIKRPQRKGPAGDTNPADDVIVASGLRAIYTREDAVRQTRDGTEIIISGVFVLNPRLPDGTPLEVRERDYVQHTDALGRLIAPMTVTNVSYWRVGKKLDHIELEV